MQPSRTSFPATLRIDLGTAKALGSRLALTNVQRAASGLPPLTLPQYARLVLSRAATSMEPIVLHGAAANFGGESDP